MSKEIQRSTLCEIIIDGSSEAIMYSDSQGVIRLWNHGAEKMFGYTEAEALGKSLDLIIPENLRERHWEGYFRVMESGSSRYSTEQLSAPALRKDGTRISTEFSMILVIDENGTVLGVAAVIRDITDQKKRENELKERIRKHESDAPLGVIS